MNKTASESSTLNKAEGPGSQAAASAAGFSKYLTFYLADEEYGIEILKVHEIIGMMPVTPVPGAPGHVKGLINLRGRVIPVVDLRLKLGMPEASVTPRTCIIVVSANGAQTGVIVDSVSEALDMPSVDIEKTPSLGSSSDLQCVLGVGKCADRITLLLDIDSALSFEDARDDLVGEDS